MKKLANAVKLIDNALMSYYENDIYSDKKAQSKTDKAWKEIQLALILRLKTK